MVLISAEPGVGKSRLAEALAERITSEPHVRLRYFCSPHHQDSALYPVIAQMDRAASVAHGDEPGARLTKLQALLAATKPPLEDVALIAELHGLPTAGLAPPLDLTPQRKKVKTFEALVRQVEGLSRQQPVLMMVDDLHWIDPSSRELLDGLIERILNWPGLLLALFRPELQPPWIERSQVTLLTWHGSTGTMRRQWSPMSPARPRCRRDRGGDHRAHRRRAAICRGTDQGGAGGQAQGAVALSAMPHPALSVPATLHASLMARLDRLGSAAKEVAQTGAAIGREFGYELLASVSDLSPPQLSEALAACRNSGFRPTEGVKLPDAEPSI